MTERIVQPINPPPPPPTTSHATSSPSSHTPPYPSTPGLARPARHQTPPSRTNPGTPSPAPLSRPPQRADTHHQTAPVSNTNSICPSVATLAHLLPHPTATGVCTHRIFAIYRSSPSEPSFPMPPDYPETVSRALLSRLPAAQSTPRPWLDRPIRRPRSGRCRDRDRCCRGRLFGQSPRRLSSPGRGSPSTSFRRRGGICGGRGGRRVVVDRRRGGRGRRRRAGSRWIRPVWMSVRLCFFENVCLKCIKSQEMLSYLQHVRPDGLHDPDPALRSPECIFPPF